MRTADYDWGGKYDYGQYHVSSVSRTKMPLSIYLIQQVLLKQYIKNSKNVISTDFWACMNLKCSNVVVKQIISNFKPNVLKSKEDYVVHWPNVVVTCLLWLAGRVKIFESWDGKRVEESRVVRKTCHEITLILKV